MFRTLRVASNSKTMGERLWASEWLDRNYRYSKNERRKVEILDISGKGLEGSLSLEGFIRLKSLICNDNKLSSIFIKDCSWIDSIHCYNNRLTSLRIVPYGKITELKCANNFLADLDLSLEEIKILDLSNNNFPEQDLSWIGKFKKIEKLWVGNSEKTIRERSKFCNCFTGSLKALQGLNKLEELDISNTDIDSGLEYLPSSTKIVFCKVDERPVAKCQVIQRLLEPYKLKDEKNVKYDYQNWRQRLESNIQIPSK